MIIRHVGGQHYDLFIDRLRNVCLFPTAQISDPTSAISVLMNIVSLKRRLELSGMSPNKTWDEIYELSPNQPTHPIPKEFFTQNVPSWETWYSRQINTNHELFRLVEKKFPWTIQTEQHKSAFQGLLKNSNSNRDALTMELKC